MKWVELSESVRGGRGNRIWVNSANVAFVRDGGTATGTVIHFIGGGEHIQVNEQADGVIAMLTPSPSSSSEITAADVIRKPKAELR